MPRQHKRLYSALSWIHTSKFQWKDPMRATRVLSLSITLAAASLLANAQTFNEVQVDLPFTITAGSTVVPAGNYEIRPLADQPDTFGFYKDGVSCKSICPRNPDRETRCGRRYKRCSESGRRSLQPLSALDRRDDRISVPYPSRFEIVARRTEIPGRQSAAQLTPRFGFSITAANQEAAGFVIGLGVERTGSMFPAASP